MANLSLPGTGSFVGGFLILTGLFQTNTFTVFTFVGVFICFLCKNSPRRYCHVFCLGLICCKVAGVSGKPPTPHESSTIQCSSGSLAVWMSWLIPCSSCCCCFILLVVTRLSASVPALVANCLLGSCIQPNGKQENLLARCFFVCTELA